MTVAHARALLGGRPIRVMPSRCDEDRTALRSLAGWANRYVPLVAPDCDQNEAGEAMPGLLGDISGCERLYHGEHNLLDELFGAVRRLGFQARIASAPTYGCAWAVARFGGKTIESVDEGGVRDALMDLPVRGLRIDRWIEEALAEIGVTTIGQVMDLPRRGLPARFGSMLTLRIDQALGEAMETIEPVRPRQPLMVTRGFDGPVRNGEAIEITTRRLLDELCERMLHRECGARHLDVVLERSDCEPYRMELSVSRFSRDAKHLWRLLRPKVERAHLGFGVEAISITASRVGPLPQHQQSHAVLGAADDGADMEAELAEVVDVLANRLGEAAVCRAEPVGSHLPERAVRFVPAMNHSGHRKPDARVASQRPPVLLPKPRPLRVLAVTPDGPLIQMQWQGESLRITQTIGPERITPEWWNPTPPHNPTPINIDSRDYFRVCDERGRWWWVYRELGSRRWFVHGGWV